MCYEMSFPYEHEKRMVVEGSIETEFVPRNLWSSNEAAGAYRWMELEKAVIATTAMTQKNKLISLSCVLDLVSAMVLVAQLL